MASLAAHSNDNKENCRPPKKSSTTRIHKAKLKAAEQKASLYQKAVYNGNKKTRRLESKVRTLETSVTHIEAHADEERRVLSAELAQVQGDAESAQTDWLAEKAQLTEHVEVLEMEKRALLDACRDHQDTLAAVRKKTNALAAKARRASRVQRKALVKAEKARASASLKAGHAYSPKARALARLLVQSGCSRNRVGSMVLAMGHVFGINFVNQMSRRTVGRAILEGLIAAKMQLAFEVSNAHAFTQSADSTSHRKVNYESHHMALKVPDYSKLLSDDEHAEIVSNIQAIRVAGLASTVDHTAATSKAEWLATYTGCLETFNHSPLGMRHGLKLTLGMFARKLVGMCGDHASSEKATSKEMEGWKSNQLIQELGDEVADDMDIEEYLQMFNEWEKRKIRDAGGQGAWDALSEVQRAVLDTSMMHAMIDALGRDTFNALPEEERRVLTLFLWVGCCMHKDQNCFKYGNTAMVALWKKYGLIGPLILANKANTEMVKRVLAPEAGGRPATEEEVAAMEALTCGRAKLAALAGAVFNNKDDKKGQGDIYLAHMRTLHGRQYPGFPPVHNSRFGSHGDAACELVLHLDDHISILQRIKEKKMTNSFTNLEENVYAGLQDIPTITELVAMSLYQQSVTRPYMRIVRGPGATVLNGLTLGPLHADVRDHCQRIIIDPEILIEGDDGDRDMDATLDGEDWDRPDVIRACRDLIPTLPHIRLAVVAFFEGALGGWIRFSSEYAPGGLIDQATDDECELAFMPATNDVNEGLLGSYRVMQRRFPTLTEHQFNALTMFSRNNTQKFMDTMFQPKDDLYVMREARKVDASGLEAEKRKQQHEFELKLVEIKRKKAAEKQRVQTEALTHLAGIHLIDSIADIAELTVKELAVQLDVLRKIWKDDQIPLKSHIKLKNEMQDALENAFLRHQKMLGELEDSIVDDLEMEYENAGDGANSDEDISSDASEDDDQIDI